MLSILLGLGMSMHLMAYQVSEQSFEQTLTTEHVNRVCAIHYEWRGNNV